MCSVVINDMTERQPRGPERLGERRHSRTSTGLATACFEFLESGVAFVEGVFSRLECGRNGHRGEGSFFV
jgi:hypothetical protein